MLEAVMVGAELFSKSTEEGNAVRNRREDYLIGIEISKDVDQSLFLEEWSSGTIEGITGEYFYAVMLC